MILINLPKIRVRGVDEKDHIICLFFFRSYGGGDTGGSSEIALVVHNSARSVCLYIPESELLFTCTSNVFKKSDKVLSVLAAFEAVPTRSRTLRRSRCPSLRRRADRSPPFDFLGSFCMTK